jgi:hypothetical protein
MNKQQKWFSGVPPTLLTLTMAGLMGGSQAWAAGSLKYPPNNCFSSQLDDRLAPSRYIKPKWSLHDTLGLPDWLSLSVENRVRYETMDGQFAAGKTGGDQQIPMQTCVAAEASYQAWRAGVEFLDARAWAADKDSSLNNTHVNESDFLQYYAAWAQQNAFDSGLGMEVKAGRQTLDYGSRRLVARNNFRNTINAFTGVSLRVLDAENRWQLNSFVTMPVQRLPNDKKSLLDARHEWDEEDDQTWFAGLNLEFYKLFWGSNAEVFFYQLNDDNRPDTLNRSLSTPGIRWYKKAAKGSFDFELETIAQVGRSKASASDSKTLDHKAWMEHFSAGYTFDAPWSPQFSVLYDYASGDSDPTDDKNGRFDSLFGARRFEFGPTGIFGAFARSNTNSPGYRLTVKPAENVSAYVGHRLFWLAEAKDAWTTVGLRDKTGNSGDFVGHLVEASARWWATENLSLETGWARIVKSDFAENAPGAPDGKDVDYFYVSSYVRF